MNIWNKSTLTYKWLHRRVKYPAADLFLCRFQQRPVDRLEYVSSSCQVKWYAVCPSSHEQMDFLFVGKNFTTLTHTKCIINFVINPPRFCLLLGFLHLFLLTERQHAGVSHTFLQNSNKNNGIVLDGWQPHAIPGTGSPLNLTLTMCVSGFVGVKVTRNRASPSAFTKLGTFSLPTVTTISIFPAPATLASTWN